MKNLDDIFNYMCTQYLSEDIESHINRFRTQNPSVELPADIKTILSNLDPGNNNYALWILNQFKKSGLSASVFFSQNRDVLKQTLSKFSDLKQPKYKTLVKENGIKLDINSYKTLDELVSDMDKVGIISDDFKSKKEKKEASLNSSDNTPILEYDDIKIYKVTNPRTAMKLAEGTEWCTAAFGMANHYLSMGPLFICYTNNTPYIQIQAESDQIKDIEDNEIYEYDTNAGIFKRLGDTEDTLRLFFALRGIPGFESIDIDSLSTKSPNTAFTYCMNSRTESEEHYNILKTNPHLLGYYLLHFGHRDYMPSIDSIIEELVKTKDVTLLSRVSRVLVKHKTIDELDNIIIPILRAKNNPTAYLEYIVHTTKDAPGYRDEFKIETERDREILSLLSYKELEDIKQYIPKNTYSNLVSLISVEKKSDFVNFIKWYKDINGYKYSLVEDDKILLQDVTLTDLELVINLVSEDSTKLVFNEVLRREKEAVTKKDPIQFLLCRNYRLKRSFSDPRSNIPEEMIQLISKVDITVIKDSLEPELIETVERIKFDNTAIGEIPVEDFLRKAKQYEYKNRDLTNNEIETISKWVASQSPLNISRFLSDSSTLFNADSNIKIAKNLFSSNVNLLDRIMNIYDSNVSEGTIYNILYYYKEITGGPKRLTDRLFDLLAPKFNTYTSLRNNRGGILHPEDYNRLKYLSADFIDYGDEDEDENSFIGVQESKLTLNMYLSEQDLNFIRSLYLTYYQA